MISESVYRLLDRQNGPVGTVHIISQLSHCKLAKLTMALSFVLMRRPPSTSAVSYPAATIDSVETLTGDGKGATQSPRNPLRELSPRFLNGQFLRGWMQAAWRIRRKESVCFFLAVLVLYWPTTAITRTLGIRLFPKTLFRKPFNTNVPFPPDSLKVSAVIMNHNRPYLLKGTKLLSVLAGHPSVSNILLLHSNPMTAFVSTVELDSNTVDTTKIHDIDAVELNQQMGLAIRFHYCATAPTEWVIIADDDMELHPAAISTLVRSMHEDSHRIVGHYGRKYDEVAAPLRHGYDTRDIFGKVEVVLTKVMILERQVCAQFGKHMHLVDDLVPQSKPVWNGEDIFVNLVANRYYNVNDGDFQNLAIEDLPVWDADTSAFPDTDSVSGNMDRNRVWNVGLAAWNDAREKANKHTYYRGLLWHTAKQRLAALGPDAFANLPLS